MSEGRALTNATGNTVATLVIAKWQGELDEERLHEVLKNPSLVDDVAADAMSGEDVDDDGIDDGYRGSRFERRPDGAAVLTR
jgi:aerobic C4-dicarboxylate transport protein